MSTEKTPELSEAPTPAKKTHAKDKPLFGGKAMGGRKRGARSLTPPEKAEAAALWRSGTVTLDGLAKKFDKVPETFSRLFKRMGIKKGEAAKALEDKTTAEIERRLLEDVERNAQRIVQVKEEHYKMSSALSKLVWAEIAGARNAGKPLDTLKGVMQTLQLASMVLSKTREELYTLLQIEKHDEATEEDSLPELTVRELSQADIAQLRDTPTETDELGLGDAAGIDMDLADDEGPAQ